jgi:hypothetical protein
MNRRIQELADQAKSQVPQGILSPELWIEQYNQRFAELIVRECAEICLEANDHKNILRHFGVDE